MQEIQAAIDELTQLRDAATPGQRGFSADWFDGSRQSLVAVERGIDGDFRSAGRIANFDGPHLTRARDGGLLIAALHRTIDAQLDFLRYQLTGFFPGAEPLVDEFGLTLARAINGVTP